MANGFSGINPQKIKNLKEEIKKLKDLLSKIVQKVESLKNQNHSQIFQKEKELEEWRNKLEVCQQEKNAISKELKDKVTELEKSQLFDNEKQTKINKLLTEYGEELEKLEQLLSDEKTQYRNIRNKLIEKLCESCNSCKEKEQSVKRLEKFNRNCLIVIWILSAIVFLLSSPLFYLAIIKKNIKKRKK